MTSSSLREISFVSALRHSPEGGHAAAVVSRANGDNGYDSRLWLVGEGEVRPLTAGGEERAFLWEDEGHLLFPAARTKAEREQTDATTYYRLPVDGGEATPAFTVPLKAVELQRVEDSRYLVTALGERDDPAPAEEDRWAGDYQVIDELPYWGNGVGFTNGKRRRLYLFDAQTGTCEPITAPAQQVCQARVAGCGRFVGYTVQGFEGVQPLHHTFCLYDLASGETRTFLEGDYTILQFAMAKEGIFLVAAKNDRWGINQNPEILRLDTETGEVETLLDRDRSLCDAVASDCRLGGCTTFACEGGKLYFTGLDGYSSHLYTLELESGAFAERVHLSGSVDGFSVCGEQLLCVAMVGQNLQEVYRVEGDQLQPVTAFNRAYLEKYPPIAPQHLTFADADGVEVDGWVLVPRDLAEGERRPAILDIHGGPKAAFGEVYYHEMQLWASQGYFVFYCNPRGSEGKGNAFAELRGAYGTYDYDDLMQFCDLVLERYPAIDEGRVGVTGGSYGGFMTNWIIGHTDRFRAAASQRSISNWLSFTYICDIGYWFGTDQMAADAWSDAEKLWWHSPLKYADNCKTPTLFIHSDEDYRCWIPEGYQMFTALKLHGVETRMCVFHGENHELSRSGKPEHRIRRLDEITAWFDRHLEK